MLDPFRWTGRFHFHISLEFFGCKEEKKFFFMGRRDIFYQYVQAGANRVSWQRSIWIPAIFASIPKIRVNSCIYAFNRWRNCNIFLCETNLHHETFGSKNSGANREIGDVWHLEERRKNRGSRWWRKNDWKHSAEKVWCKLKFLRV